MERCQQGRIGTKAGEARSEKRNPPTASLNIEIGDLNDYPLVALVSAPSTDNVGNVDMPPINQETINDNAKLIMHRLVARALSRDRSLVDRSKAALARDSVRFPDRTFIADWEKLLCLPTQELRARLTSRDQEMKRLRLSSPFVTSDGVDFSDYALRRRIRQAAKRIAARATRPSSD